MKEVTQRTTSQAEVEAGWSALREIPRELQRIISQLEALALRNQIIPSSGYSWFAQEQNVPADKYSPPYHWQHAHLGFEINKHDGNDSVTVLLSAHTTRYEPGSDTVDHDDTIIRVDAKNADGNRVLLHLSHSQDMDGNFSHSNFQYTGSSSYLGKGVTASKYSRSKLRIYHSSPSTNPPGTVIIPLYGDEAHRASIRQANSLFPGLNLSSLSKIDEDGLLRAMSRLANFGTDQVAPENFWKAFSEDLIR